MKKTYCKPQVAWVPIRPAQPVAAPCWANAGKKPIYHDVPGHGYCEAHLSDDGCGKATVITVTFPDATHMTSQEKEAAEAWMLEHLAEKIASAGNNMASFKGSGFTTHPDPDWS